MFHSDAGFILDLIVNFGLDIQNLVNGIYFAHIGTCFALYCNIYYMIDLYMMGYQIYDSYPSQHHNNIGLDVVRSLAFNLLGSMERWFTVH